MTDERRRVLVTGATGKTGRLVLALLAGHPRQPVVRVLVRAPEQAAAFAQRGFETVVGDVRDETTSWADSAMRDVTAVISTFGGTPFSDNNLWQVDYEGTQRLIAAAKIAQVEHYLFVSTMGVRRERSILYPLSILFYPKLMAEDVIRRSGIPYTILRPGGLVDTRLPEGGHNTRSEVAEALIAALDRPEARNQTFELSAERRAEPGADRVLGVRV